MIYFATNTLSNTSSALRISGPDAYTYLQGQFTQDLNHPEGSATFGLWLNQKGRAVAESTVLRLHENEFILFGRGNAAGVLRERLESYLVADEVNLADESTQWSCVTVVDDESGPSLASLLGGGLPATGRFLARDGGFIFRGRQSARANIDWWIPATALASVRESLRASGAREVDAALMESERIGSGLAAVPRDIGPGDLPNEGGLEVEAISYTKGCFLGQEVMARLKNLGQVRRRLHLVRGPGPAPAAGELLFSGDKKVGEIRSSASREDGFVAIAMLTLLHLDGSPLARSAGGPADVVVVRPAGAVA